MGDLSFPLGGRRKEQRGAPRRWKLHSISGEPPYAGSKKADEDRREKGYGRMKEQIIANLVRRNGILEPTQASIVSLSHNGIVAAESHE